MAATTPACHRLLAGSVHQIAAVAAVTFVIEGLGPLTQYYYEGSGATTTIVDVPPDATMTVYDDNGTGGGSTSSALGRVVTLIGRARNSGGLASTTPSKNHYRYPRPFRQSADVVVAPITPSGEIIRDPACSTVGPVEATRCWRVCPNRHPPGGC